MIRVVGRTEELFMKSTRVLVGSMILLFAVALYPTGVTAHHRWGKYHWARTSNPLLLAVANNVTSEWDSHFSAAVSDWDDSNVLALSSLSNGGKEPVQCAPTPGRIDVCNAAYGANGWLGIAQIWIGGGSHITQAITKLNDTYFNTPDYDSDAWRQFVMCQEIGHDFGLDHQDERFNNTNLGTCMDYTNDPDGTIFGQLPNLTPNAHDYEQLASIYSHLDGGGGGGGSGGGGGGRGRPGGAGSMPLLPQQAIDHLPDNDQGSWGRMVASNGRVARFVLDLGNGNFVVTHVIWA
jgi:hypothetical protein